MLLAGLFARCYRPDSARGLQGWVVTDMGGDGADITVAESVEGMKTLLEQVTASDSGKFYRWNGTEHPW